MIDPIYIIPDDICLECKREEALECYTTDNTPISFSFLLKKYNSGEKIVIFDRKSLSHFKCKNCGNIYQIAWNKDFTFPKPMRYNITYNIFIDKFINESKYPYD